MLSRFGDLIGGTFKAGPVLVLSSVLVVMEHTIAVFHGEYFVINASVISVLIPKVVELLS